jgi:hypothetical protein
MCSFLAFVVVGHLRVSSPVRFEVLTGVTTKICWDVAPCNLVCVCGLFEGTYYVCILGSCCVTCDLYRFKRNCFNLRGIYRKHIPEDSKKYSRNRPWRPIGLWDVKDPTLFRQSAHRWRQGCQPYAPAVLYSPETLCICFWYSFLLEAE